MQTIKPATECTIMADYGGCYAWDLDLMPSDLDGLFPKFKGIADLKLRYESWQRKFESRVPDMNDGKIHNFDWASFHSEGIGLCRELKAMVGDRAKIFYWKPFEDPDDISNKRYEITADGSLA